VGFAHADQNPAWQYGYISQTVNSLTKMVWLNADVIGGDSGGACFDTQGRLVAVQSHLRMFYSAGTGESASVEQIRDYADQFLPRAKTP
jgi:hypothetical protein